SDLLLVAARPGRGKTSFVLSVALHAIKMAHKRVAVFSLEMSNDQLASRLIAQETGINSQRLRQGRLEEDEWSRFTQAVNLVSETGLYLDDTPAISALSLRTKCRRLHSEVKLDLIVVDYLQLMTADSRHENRVQEVSYISRSLKRLARELNVPVLAAAQLSRAVEQRAGQKAILSDLRESGSLEMDSDVVMFLHHPDEWDDDPNKKNLTELIVAKHRNGPTGSVNLIFLESLAKFVDAETRTVSFD
ncbi:MAG: replicative DNA helicase, partial [Patescibacteria group bacterium]